MKRSAGKITCVLLYCAFLGLVAAEGGDIPTAPPRERIEWCDVWHTDADKTDRPRVLLIGDSIAQGYFPQVEAELGAKAYCSRFTTSRAIGDPVFLQELKLVLGQYRYGVIHFNNGLHGWGYSEVQYANAFEKLLRTLREEGHGAAMIWASTTPVSPKSSMENDQQRVLERNAIAAECVTRAKIPINDLHAISADHPEHLAQDGVHFAPEGKALQAAAVVRAIEDALAAATQKK